MNIPSDAPHHGIPDRGATDGTAIADRDSSAVVVTAAARAQVSAVAAPTGLAPVPLTEIVAAAVDTIVDIDRAMAQLAAVRAEMINTARRLSGLPDPDSERRGAAATLRERSFRAEIATALRIPERTAETLIATSAALVQDLPQTLHALHAGAIGYIHAGRIADAAAFISSAEDRSAFERAAVGIATEATPAILTRKLRALRDRIQPETLPERHARALVDREVAIDAGHDGMGWLSAYLPAVELIAIDGRLTDAARALHSASDDRTIAQLRADILLDVLLDDPPAISPPTI